MRRPDLSAIRTKSAILTESVQLDTESGAKVWMSATERERVFVGAAAQGRAIAALIESLDAEQLATPGPCAGWDVKTVAVRCPGC
ncbi:MAG: maleylpyruvate isomerase N-terminal domain-containing protein [Mycobacterium sp.]|nr:maleylpyruvate isomerase N-terminal domain-containing protein [Mycobacterium sp.]